MPKRIDIEPNTLLKREPTPTVSAMIGETYTRLTVTGYAGYKITNSGFQYHFVWCECSCGKIVLGNSNHIHHGKWRSCGCLRVDYPNRFKHGYAPLKGKRDKIYVTWQGIHKRCSATGRNDSNRKYAEKGIKVCAGWSGETGFENFKRQMLPITDKSIDRINNDLHYSCGECEECKANKWPFNCRWGNDNVQSNNRGDFNNWITIGGIEMTYRQADRYLGFPIKTLQTRIRGLGWSEERAVSTPILNNKTRRQYLNT